MLHCQNLPHFVFLWIRPDFFTVVLILSRASEVGSPTNHPGLRAATRHGVRDPLVRSQVETDHTFDMFLLRQGEPGTSQ